VAESTGSFTNQSTRDGATARKEKKRKLCQTDEFEFSLSQSSRHWKIQGKIPFNCDIRAIRSL
jgi:hypothetical protein